MRGFRHCQAGDQHDAAKVLKDNTPRLDVAGMKALLLKLDFMQHIARGEHAVAED